MEEEFRRSKNLLHLLHSFICAHSHLFCRHSFHLCIRIVHTVHRYIHIYAAYVRSIARLLYSLLGHDPSLTYDFIQCKHLLYFFVYVYSLPI